MSITSAWTALKTAVCCGSDQVVSALRDLVHYILNYIFKGRRPRHPRGEVVVRGLWVVLGGP